VDGSGRKWKGLEAEADGSGSVRTRKLTEVEADGSGRGSGRKWKCTDAGVDGSGWKAALRSFAPVPLRLLLGRGNLL
jgi:hypothetical protein